jgi:hypothetical protein
MASLVSEDLRALMGEFYLSGTPLGKRLEELLPRVERWRVRCLMRAADSAGLASLRARS